MTQTHDQASGHILERARAALDTGSLQDAVDTSAAARHRVLSGVVSDLALVRTIAAEVEQHGLPDDVTELGQRIVDNRAANERANATAKALEHIEGEAKRRLAEQNRTNLDPALAVLRTELTVICDQAVQVLDDLGDIDTAEQAVDQDLAAEWRAATRLAERYTRVRDAQQILVSAALSTSDRPDSVDPAIGHRVDCFGVVRNGDQHCELFDYANWDNPHRRHTAHELMVDRPSREKPATPPWLVINRVAVLRFLVRADVEPWVPSIREMDAEQQRVADTRTADEPEPRSWEDMGRRDPSELAYISGHESRPMPMVRPATGLVR